MIVEGYSMDLYCDCRECTAARRSGNLYHPAQFGAYSKGYTTRQARAEGWRISRDRRFCFAPGHRVIPTAEREAD